MRNKIQKAKRKQKKSLRKQAAINTRLAASKKFAHQLEYWHKLLAPEFSDMDPHDLTLIIASLLKTPKKRTEIMFLKRREDGFYVF